MIQIQPSNALPREPSDGSVSAAGLVGSGRSGSGKPLPESASLGPGLDAPPDSGAVLWYPKPQFPARRPFSSGPLICSDGASVVGPEGPLVGGARLVSIQAFTSPLSGCIESLWQKYQIGDEDPILIKAGTVGPLVSLSEATAQRLTWARGVPRPLDLDAPSEPRSAAPKTPLIPDRAPPAGRRHL